MINHRNFVRAALLAPLLASFFGPWAYSSDGVPPAEWCAAPYILLESGRCVGLLTGAFILTFMVGAFFSLLAGLVSGAIFSAEWGRLSPGEILFVLFPFVLVLPFFSTLLLIRGGNRWRARWLHLAALALACLAGIPLIVSSPELPPGRLWGVWLYGGSAAGAILWELLILASGKWTGRKVKSTQELGEGIR